MITMKAMQQQFPDNRGSGQWGLRNSVVWGLAWLLCAGCTASQYNTYPGANLPDEQVARVQVPGIVYSVDGSTRNPGGTSYHGLPGCLSLVPGEHDFIMVIPQGFQTKEGWVYTGEKNLWYGIKVTLTAGKEYVVHWRFIERPTLLDQLPGILATQKVVEQTELVMIESATGQQVGTGTRVKGKYE
jgi:hypothetical protein